LRECVHVNTRAAEAGFAFVIRKRRRRGGERWRRGKMRLLWKWWWLLLLLLLRWRRRGGGTVNVSVVIAKTRNGRKGVFLPLPLHLIELHLVGF